MILSVIYHITNALTFVLAMIYFIHMFQLNGYHRDAHLRWTKDNAGAICARLTFVFLSFVCVCVPFNFLRALAVVFNAVSIYFLLPKKAKKPLVYTMRIKRLITTCILIYIVFFAVGKFANNIFLFVSLCVIVSNFVVLFSDILNAPLEKAVKLHYINDAKKILKSHKNLKIIGITGSYGKTSCKYFLTKILSAKYNVLMTPESYNTPMGVVRTVREMMKNHHEIFVCEMGAKNIGDIKELCDIVYPQHGIITSVGPQHLESFKKIENVVSTKFELCDAIPDNGKIYLNYDNEYIRNRKTDKKVISYGCEYESCDYFAKNITVSERGTDFDVCKGDNVYHFSTKLLGRHNVQNLVGCIALALDFGVEYNDISLAVLRLESVPHRLQMIDGGNITIIDDAFNANPSGTKAALEVLSAFNGVKVIVTPGMIELGNKQNELNMEFGKNCAAVCDYILLVGKKIADSVYDGVMQTDFDKQKLLRFDTVQQAVEFARSLNVSGKKFVLLENDLPDNY